MRLYLIRHGKAQRHSASGRDRDRDLAERGKAQARWLGEHLRSLDQPPGVVLASPANRAAQTAAIIAETLGLPVDTAEWLDLGTPASEIVDALGGLDPETPAALVGHNPTLSILVEVLCQGPGGGGCAELRTGQAAVIDLRDPADAIGGGGLVDLLRGEAD